MALKALILRNKLNSLRGELDALREKDAEFQRREAELEAAIGEAKTDEDLTAAEGLVSEFEQEKAAHEAEKTRLTGEVEKLEADLAAEEAKSPAPPAGQNSPPAGGTDPEPASDRGGGRNYNTREDDFSVGQIRGFLTMDSQRRDAFLARQEVKDFLQRVRELGVQHRAVTGADLTIPEDVLGLIRENVSLYSKLIGRVNLQRVPGTARMTILGSIPEAVWTEACATLNELNVVFNSVEVDGYKVGGFIAICNATLEDSDLNLASILIDAIGKAIGIALDKAILYGTGVKMPVGVVTRLAQTAQPAGWSTSAPAWADLHTSNVKKLAAATGTAFFKSMLGAVTLAKSKYSRGRLTWVMSEATKAKITTEGIDINAAGAIVSGVRDTMPVLGGDIVTLDFVPANDVIFGYFDLYLLAERAGTTLARSEHARFIQDQTVFKGTARYDGAPVFGEAFGLININNAAPTTTVTFAPDTANTVQEDTD